MHQPCVPHFQLLADQPTAVVTRWGTADGLLFQPGDRLLLGNAPGGVPAGGSDPLLVLKPRGYGAIMLGRRRHGRLLAEPGQVPASPLRWDVIGCVVAVERPIAHICSNGGLGILGLGGWLPAPLTQWLLNTGGQAVSWTVLDPLVRRLSLSIRQAGGVQPAGLVFGRTAEAASALPARSGWVRFVLQPPQPTACPFLQPAISPYVEHRVAS